MKNPTNSFKHIKNILVFLLFLSPHAHATQEITLGFDPWCPHTCDGTLEGIGVEITKMALKSNDIEVKTKILPWPRAVEMARKGEIHGIIGALKADAPDFVFPGSDVGHQESCIYTIKDAHFSGPKWQSDLKNKKMGVVNGYTYGQEIDEFIAHPHSNGPKIDFISGINTVERLIEKLLKNRIDAFVEDRSVIEYYIKNHPRINLKNIYCLKKEPLFLAFSPNEKIQSKVLMQLFDKGVGRLRDSGELKLIYKKYGISH